jgi:DNA-binding GntR family transcriptional regulator
MALTGWFPSGLWYAKNQNDWVFRARLATKGLLGGNEMSGLQLKIVPIHEALSLKARTYEALKAAITNLSIYDPKAELKLDERDLSERFGVSRTPLREALAQLETEGLVKIVARRGIFIVRKTKSEILDMITVWAALESMAARLATKDASDDDLRGLREHIDAFSIDEVAQNMGEYSDANIRFHQTIIGLGGCPLISKLAEELFFHVRAIRNRTIGEQDRARRSITDHREIVSALEARDADKAERLVREHTLRLRDHVERFVDIE